MLSYLPTRLELELAAESGLLLDTRTYRAERLRHFLQGHELGIYLRNTQAVDIECIAVYVYYRERQKRLKSIGEELIG